MFSYLQGEGCRAIAIVPVESAKSGSIYVNILETSFMSDSTYASITAPDGSAQKNLIERTLEVANLAPSAVDYIVARGTGTALGDPIEVEALAEECHCSTAPLSIRGGGNNEGAFNGVEYVPPSMEQDGHSLITYCSRSDEDIRNLCVKLWKKVPTVASCQSAVASCQSTLST